MIEMENIVFAIVGFDCSVFCLTNNEIVDVHLRNFDHHL